MSVWNSFRSGFPEMKVGEDGYGPVQPADLSGSHEAPGKGGKLRWYHEKNLVLCLQKQRAFYFIYYGNQVEQ